MGRGLWACAAPALALAMAMLTGAGAPVAGAVLDDVKERGTVRCGVATRPMFVSADAQGNWKGFEIDLCRAVAAAVLGDPGAIDVQPLSGLLRFEALRHRDVDVLFASTTWTLSRDTGMGVSFAGVFFHDGQGFLAHRAVGVHRLAELRDATVCVTPGTTTEQNLLDYIRTRNPTLKPVLMQTHMMIQLPFVRRDCLVITDDASGLASIHASLLGGPDDYILFPERISKEPLSAAVNDDEPAWFHIIRWVLFAVIAAEEKGITAATADDRRRHAADPEILRLLGAEGDIGRGLGLDRDWAWRIIRAVGNYGEIFDRNLGKDSPYKLERGLNALWTEGGLMYAPPFH